MKKGNEEKRFERFMMRVVPPMNRAITRYISGKESVEDVRQESLLKLWVNFRSCPSSERRMVSWACVVGKNQAISALRRLRREREILYRGEELDVAAVGEVIDHRYSSKIEEDSEAEVEIPEEVKSALMDLPQAQRTAFLLKLHGYSYDDLSVALAISVGTVKSRVHMARRKLLRKFAVG